MKIKKSIDRKKGGTITFIEDLVKDKADFLAFYFIINGIDTFDKINISILEEYLNNINDKYNECLKLLNKDYKELENTYNISNYGYLLYELNNTYNNINKNNYGTEGHIIDNLINPNSVIFYTNINIYISMFKKQNLNKYTLKNYIDKIGYDLAIYEYIYNKKILIYNIKELFILYIENFYKSFDVNDFITKVNSELKNIISHNIIFELSKDNEPLIKLQQYYNFYKYPTKFINLTIKREKNLLYHNTRILNINLEENHIYNNEMPLNLNIFDTILSKINDISK